MPVIDLNDTQRVFRGTQEIFRIYDGASLIWTSANVGQQRAPTAASATIGFEGNSQLALIPGPDFGGIFATIWPGTVAATLVAGGSLAGAEGPSEVSPSTWAADGPGRNADFTGGGLLFINEGLLPSQFATGYPALGTDQANDTLEYVGGYARTAAAIGADALVISTNYPHSDYPLWDQPVQHAQFWRAHALMHNPEAEIWIFPLSYLVEAAEAYYGGSVYVDNVHLDNGNRPALMPAIGHAAEYFCTKSLPAGYAGLSGDVLALTDIFMGIIADYRYAGFGGTSAPADLLYDGAPLSPSNDPLPAPGLLPGEGTPGGTAPAQPLAPTFSAISESGASVSWAAPDDGGSAITSYTLEWREVGGSTTTITDATSPEALTGLTPARGHEARVTAINAIGASAPSPWGDFVTGLVSEGTPTTLTGPAFSPALPAASGGYRTIASAPGVITHVATLAEALDSTDGAYLIMAVRRSSVSEVFEMMTLQAGPIWYNAPYLKAVAQGFAGAFGAAFESGSTGQITLGSMTPGWSIIELWAQGDTVWGCLDGGSDQTATVTAGTWSLTHIGIGGYHAGSGEAFDLAAHRVIAGIPNAASRAAMRSWIAGQFPPA